MMMTANTVEGFPPEASESCSRFDRWVCHAALQRQQFLPSVVEGSHYDPRRPPSLRKVPNGTGLVVGTAAAAAAPSLPSPHESYLPSWTAGAVCATPLDDGRFALRGRTWPRKTQPVVEWGPRQFAGLAPPQRSAAPPSSSSSWEPLLLAGPRSAVRTGGCTQAFPPLAAPVPPSLST